MQKIKTSFSSGAVCEVRRFNYELGGYLMAEIEIMVYSDKEYRAKAIMFAAGKSILLRETFTSIDKAMDSIVAEVEKNIRKDNGLEEKAS